MQELKATVAELREGPVARADLTLRQVYDETVYINQSIGMLRTNLLLGVGLAVGILWWFMRRLRATVIVALAIPVSLFVAFALLETTGRTLNIISLAGLALWRLDLESGDPRGVVLAALAMFSPLVATAVLVRLDGQTGLGGLAKLRFSWWIAVAAGVPVLLAGAALGVGAVSYGASIVLYISAAQSLGATRSQMVFATSPFFGVVLAVAWLGEGLSVLQAAAFGLMLLSLALLFLERHDHEHVHEPLVHTHSHRHDDGHHDHVHAGLPASHRHTHEHEHERVTHAHPHWPDLHHRHVHDG